MLIKIFKVHVLLFFCSEMNFDYTASLSRVRDARNKRSRVNITKKFFDTLRRENIQLPMFDVNKSLVNSYASLRDDSYSNELLRSHAPNDSVRQLVAKSVNGNGNCLFNSASVALIGN